jgi:hypothetical protein
MSGAEEVASMAARGYEWGMSRNVGGGAGRTWSVIESGRVVRPMGTQR